MADTATTPISTEQTCHACRQLAPTGAKFCPNCGGDIRGASKGGSGKAIERLKAIALVIAIGAGVYVYAFGLPEFTSKLDLNVEVKPSAPNQRYGFVFITNLAPEPVNVTEVRINRRTDAACAIKVGKSLNTGENTLAGTGASISGFCGGTISVVTVVTDRTEAEYSLRWR